MTPQYSKSLKILHTADWHIGKRLEKFSRIDEQQQVFNHLCELANAQEVDIILVSGDLFDSYKPDIVSIKLWLNTLVKLTNGGKRVVVVVSGNHDAPEFIDVFSDLVLDRGIIVVSKFSHTLPAGKLTDYVMVTKSSSNFIELEILGIDFPVRIITTPYATEKSLSNLLLDNTHTGNLAEYVSEYWAKAELSCNADGVNILMAHLLFIDTLVDVNNIPKNEPGENSIIYHGGSAIFYPHHIPNCIQYVALGHLHKHHTLTSSNENTVISYSGSPLVYSLSESGQSKYAIEVNLLPNERPQLNPIELKGGFNIVRETVEGVFGAIEFAKDNQDNYIELLVNCSGALSEAEIESIYKVHNKITRVIPQISRLDTQPSSLDEHYQLEEVNIEQLLKNFLQSKQNINSEELEQLYLELYHSTMQESEVSNS
ncbi:MAG: exonuclease subunit SbcD [Bacteroidota bacterium]|nr:exonuclease subunit SbcD [Bacteroidota bacterium]